MSDALEKTEAATPTPWHIYEESDCDGVISRGMTGANGKGLNRGEDCELFTAEDARRAVASVNKLADLTVEAIEQITPAHILAAVSSQAVESRRVAELEAALRDMADEIEGTFSETDLQDGGSESLLGGWRDRLRAARPPAADREGAENV
jgi:hypothetical protein